MIIVAILTVRAEQADAYREYERKAAAAMGRYGGRLERVVAIPAAEGGATFREVHLLSFPDEGAFAAYRGDPVLQAAAEQRAAAVIETEILIGEEGPDYGR